MDSIADRVRARREEFGWNQTDLAREIGGGVKPQNIQQLEDGKVLRPRYLPELAIALKVSSRWLTDGIGEPEDIRGLLETAFDAGIESKAMFSRGRRKVAEESPDYGEVGEPIHVWEDVSELDPEHYIKVPRFDVQVSAGNGSIVYSAQEKEKPQSFRLDWVQRQGWKPDNLLCMYADGDSMEPSIADGATLLVNKGDTAIRDGRVYVIRFGSNIRVKRLYQRVDGGLIVQSDNPAHKDIEVPADQMEHIAVIGRVVWQAGLL